MDHHAVARFSLAVFCGLQGAGTVAIDMNHTHATHPQWPGHARFHVVWQTATVAALSLLETALILVRGPFEEQRVYLAAILAGLPMLGFFIALSLRGLYGGSLSDPGGVPPLIVAVRGSEFRLDLNVVAEVGAIAVLVAIVALYRSG